MNGKRIMMAGLLGAMVAGCGWGCSAADDYLEARKAAREEKAAKAKLEAEEAERAKAEREKQERRAKWGREDTVKDEVPLHVSNPSAWFHETDETMRQIRQRLLAAITEMDRMQAKYEERGRDAAERMEGYPKLAADLRAALESDRWPVAVDRFYLDSAEKCRAKLAEVEARSGKTGRAMVQDQVFLNGVEDYAAIARRRLAEFDDDYGEFSRRWDMFRAGRVSGTTKELDAQVKDAVAITKRFLDEWEEVK
ncbi:MAG: hypothetical protein IKQ15_11900 [Kiritimatiellae bacterium]|nr:hypothetical protein [Kiritimatiellia bacterium]